MQRLVIRLLVFLALAGSANAGQTTYYFNFSPGGTGSFVYDNVALTATAITFDFGSLGSIAPYSFDKPLTATVFGTPPSAAIRQNGTFFGVTRVAGVAKATVRLYTDGTYCLRPSPEPFPDYCLVTGTYRISTTLDPVVQAVWSATGSMSTPRYHHSSTLLGDGKVLVSGGRNDTNLGTVLRSAELYDPSSRTWSSTGLMNSARQNQIAIRLLDGRVLVSGGTGTSGSIASAEIYNPTLGTWSATGSMITARSFARAALLPNGRVLVMGGMGPAGVLATAEIYNPATGTWSAAASMTTARYAPTASVLADGRVLVTGGGNSSGAGVTSAEIYDPATSNWAATGAMTGGRYLHAGTRLWDGRVLVTGGWNGTSALASAEIFNPASGTWAPAGSLSSIRYSHTAALLPNGKAIVMGGDTDTAALASADIYDPALGTWSPASSMTTARKNHAATVLADGDILVSGGFSAGAHLASAEIYGDPPPNQAPVANPDSATTLEDVAVEINVLGNDTDADGHELFIHALGQPAHGTTSLTADGQRVLYTPASGYNGPDAFTYAIRDIIGAATAPVNVSVTVMAVNDEPVVLPDSANTNEDTAVVIRVTDNDSDPDADTLSVVSVSRPAHGTVAITGAATVRYTPVANFSGPDTFTYVVSDGNGATASATVSVSVQPVNDGPAAHSQTVLVLRGRSQPITIAASDLEDDALTFSVVAAPSHGSLEGTAPNVVYRPAPGYIGADSFTFTASDGSATGNTGTVTIDVDATVWDVNGPDSGTVLSMAVDPASASIVYARTPRSLWKSMDGGSTWSLILQPPQGGWGLAVDGASSLVVYVGVRNGIRKTTDGGATWQTHVVGTAANFVSAVGVDPFDTGVLFAASSQGVFKSVDAGVTWAPVGTLNQVTHLWMDPLTAGTMYVRTSAGLLKSTDAAVNWTSIQAGLGDGVTSLDFHPNTPGSFYALTSAAIFKTTDGGATWTARTTGLSGGDSLQAIAVDPSAPETVYASFYYGLYRSTNGGGNWTAVYPQFNTFGIGAFALHRDAPGRVLVGSEAGVLRSIDFGVSWSRSTTGLRAGRTTVVARGPAAPGVAFAGLYAAGPFKTVDAGANWSQPLLPNTGVRAMVASPHAPSRIFVGMTCGGIARSSDSGVTWTYGAPGITGSLCVTALAADPLTPGAVLAGMSDGRIYRTTSNGDAWVAASAGLLANHPINAIVYDPSSPGVAYAATDDAGVFKSTDAGASWTPVNSGITALSVTALAVDAASGVMYAAAPNPSNSAFKSTDGGATWTPVGLGGVTINALLVDPATRYVYAGAADGGGTVAGGVYVSTNGGGSWSALTRKGFVTTDIKSLALVGGRLFAGAWDGSVGVLMKSTTPLLTVPANMTVEASSAGGAVVTYLATAADDGDPSPSVSCSPASGSTFPITTTAVSCTATNAWGRSASGTFSVTVVDTLPPALSLPSPVTVEATSSAGAVATYHVSAVDLVDAAPMVSCVPASGSTFPLGTMTVTCSASDAAGNSVTGSFDVRVRDTVRPVLSGLPASRTVEATGPSGAVVTWTSPTAVDAIAGPVPVTCSPASGSTFALLITTSVTCSTSDPSGNTTTASFTVRVVDTQAPSIFLDFPRADDLSVPLDTFNDLIRPRVLASDTVGVLSVRVALDPITSGTPLSRVAGSPQSGTFEAPIAVDPNRAMVLTVRASDLVGNTITQTVTVDNDGIGSNVDRARNAFEVSQATVYSSEFNTSSTAGTLVRQGGRFKVTGGFGGGVRAELLKEGTPGATHLSVCTGAAKQVLLNRLGDIADLTCTGDTVRVTAIRATTTVTVRKLITYRVCLFTCSNIQAWSYTELPQGQSMSTGSPTVADPENTEPLYVYFAVVNEDGTETVVGSLNLDPGEAVDPGLVEGSVEGSVGLDVDVLAGDVTMTVGGETTTVGAGGTVRTPVAKVAQTIAFGPISDQLFGAQIPLTGASSSGLPVSFSAVGPCSASGQTLTITGIGSCTVTAMQGGDDTYLPAAPVSQTFNVRYSWSGVLAPLAADGASTAKLGSTVPVKFQLTGASAAVTNLPARLLMAKVSNQVVEGIEVPAGSTGSADAGNVFRYDALSGQYIFNWSTRGLSEGTWSLRIDLLDGGTHTVLVGLKK